ncbi:gliding motility-associated C-terminal domain-containing protein [Hymenobacter sp. DH14]|uniref:Gliding motility-associated C-terminal domain-containing protein n=1 Tax=Hymenobacter cyanobacteriorum TaxID=2926463 RepID=A0A9X1VFI2_9BACT|nr:gliding motility-associated C-terminal domain-containing protein [Hymenobacter cyanobacteriorum]MCI1188204.1 gliding motility-associated C-terminal domain-containing protein [Hymenobacter cyanobacteriorum]
MKKTLLSFWFLLLACALLGGLPTAQASHLLGCDMTYTSLGGNQYRVRFRLYRDCSGAPTPDSFDLICRNGGCNAPASVTADLLPVGQTIAATPLCPTNPTTCSNPSGTYPLYDFTNYEATVTLAPGQWTMSTRLGNRPDIGNLTGGAGNYLYTEAYLDNRGTSVVNTSPQFDPLDIPIQYVCVNQLTTFGFSAIEPDGDSLVYSLAAPLDNCGVPIAYKPYPGALGGVVILSRNPLCVLEFPSLTGGSTYTPQLPLPVASDTTGSCPIKQGVPYFRLNQQARTVTFKPNVYLPNLAAGDGGNKYVVVVEVNEYRRINGVRRIIGRVRREAVLIVIDCGTNTTPNPVTAQNQTPNSNTATTNTVDTTRISVYSCNYSRVLINFTDPDNLKTPSAHQRLTVTLPATINSGSSYLASGDVGVFSFSTDPAHVNGSENPQATFIFQPSPNMVGRVIRINVGIEDNACPVKGRQNRVIVIRILKGNFATALATAGGSSLSGVSPITLCNGSLALNGSVVRPDSIRNPVTGKSVLQTYAYQWSLVRGNGFNTATATNKNITVTPTVTSRYRLLITPTGGFGPGCGDTTSILVRVAPPVAARFTITDSISSRPVSNTGIAPGRLVPPITYKFTNQSTINGQVPCASGVTTNCYTSPEFRLDSLRWTYQRIKDGAGNPTTNAPVVVFARGYTPRDLKLTDGGTYLIKLSAASTLITNGTTSRVPGQCSASVFQRLVIVPELNVPNIITPNNDNLNDVFVLPVSQRGGKLEIFNRWGNKVQEYSNYQNTWAGAGQPDGVYYYYITDTSGNKSKGWVEVRRGQ